MKNRWFYRIEEDIKRISPHLRLQRIRNGFYRVFWDKGYVGEFYENLPENGHDIVDLDHRLEEQKYLQENMDDGDIQRQVKNFVEGYYEVLRKLQTRCYMLKNDSEYNKTTMEGYKQIRYK